MSSRHIFHLTRASNKRCFSNTAIVKPVKRQVSAQDRISIRQARKAQVSQALQKDAAATATSSSSSVKIPRYTWYFVVGVPSILLAWGLNDEDSPPARFSKYIGFTDFVQGYTDQVAKPSHDKLLPDWSQMPNVPHDIPVPHTLVLDLENTLVSSTWDRKYGWRHAKRPGVDKFLTDLAQYYEIVLYSPSIDGIADPVVTALDKNGAILHRLYRDATYYHNGVHVKDLNRLNRNVNRMIVIDDDPAEVQFNPENLIRVKPYDDPNDRSDNTLARITPFLIEIAREGYSDIPQLLAQYRGMDADQIADEQDRRVSQLRFDRQRRARQGLGGLAGRAGSLPPPELSPSDIVTTSFTPTTKQLTAKDIAGAAPESAQATSGIMGWLNQRNKHKEEQNMLKMEKWTEVMMEKQKQRQEAEKRAAAS